MLELSQKYHLFLLVFFKVLLRFTLLSQCREESLSIVLEDVTIEHLFSYLATRSGIYKYLEEKNNQNEAPTLWKETIERLAFYKRNYQIYMADKNVTFCHKNFLAHALV